jgi:hypothetical protein
MKLEKGQRVVAFYKSRLCQGVIYDMMSERTNQLGYQFLVKLDRAIDAIEYLNCSMVYPILDNVSVNKIKALEVLLKNENT